MIELARELVAPYRGSPYRIGYFSDNEVGWWAGALFVFYSTKPAEHRHQAALGRAAARRTTRDDWPRFAADFAPPAGVDSWDELLAATEIDPAAAGRQRHRRRCANGPASSPSTTTRWSRGAIRAADPDALYFGDRLPIYYDPVGGARDGAAMSTRSRSTTMSTAGDGWVARYFFDGLRQAVAAASRC